MALKNKRVTEKTSYPYPLLIDYGEKTSLYKESAFTQIFQAMRYFALDTAFENHTHEYTNSQETRQ